jgi:hypothetical protein
MSLYGYSCNLKGLLFRHVTISLVNREVAQLVTNGLVYRTTQETSTFSGKLKRLAIVYVTD